MGGSGNGQFFPLTSLQIGLCGLPILVAQSAGHAVLSFNLDTFLAPESSKFFVLVDNRPWLMIKINGLRTFGSDGHQGNQFYDAQEVLSSSSPCGSSNSNENQGDKVSYCHSMDSNCPCTPPSNGPYKKRKIMNANSDVNEVNGECGEVVSCSGSTLRPNYLTEMRG
ncbi:hypothetical protein KSP40_PGU017965 [Platanthera guangdongensis]|uniref:Uncharacterized protein n=1 Tax=Platanthera guangdongensis TaxID=2320717 RepID=A0ABR2LTK1_9ASPA